MRTRTLYVATTLTRRMIALLSGACLIVPLCSTAARQDAPAAPPLVASAMRARAERFLRAVSALSPVGAGTDAARAQAWPIPADSRIQVLDRSTGQVIEQTVADAPVKVFEHQMWDDPARGPAWVVRGYRGEITIRADGRVVTGFIDTCLSHALAQDPPPAVANCLKADAAVRRGSLYIRAAGVDCSELVLDRAYINSLSRPPQDAADLTWNLTWRRYTAGAMYDDQAVNVVLDAGKGRLYAYGCALSAARPSVMRLDVSAPQAADVARRFLAGMSWTITDEPTVLLRIVLPSDFWAGVPSRAIFRGWQPHRKPYTRLAWVVRCQTDWPATNPTRWDVWVDAATGEVIGGDEYGGAPRGRATAETTASQDLLRTLARARWLTLRAIGGAGAPLVLEPAGAPIHYYGALGAMTAMMPDHTPHPAAPTHRLEARFAHGEDMSFGYDAATGLIWSGDGGILQAGPELRSLLSGKRAM